MSTSRLEQARRLLAVAQTGLAYGKDKFDIQRFEEIAAIAHAQMAELIGDTTAEDVARIFMPEAGYANPKLDVRAAVFSDNKILLVREMSDGLWTLPGGWADVGASPAQCAAREVLEEAGYVVRITRFLKLIDMLLHPHPVMPFHIWKLVFEGEITAQARPDGIETDGVAFFAEDALPPLSLGRILPEQIARLFALHRNGQVEFD
ncbi:NUDIX hydrolase [Silvimonas iriomotensis]|uniref:ADP-ribose pyrophosphatase n=1 Tax=Silvimonas iriomotensis TaxID=449662 RepID=A0ABQ2PEH9_9NEIS|nr:NUDIX hydrolase [Silvimonas iriomotensis]GGP23718.1 ADP-ribose pyrophosphatase [Silvimonas iriomotensis]